jgi:stage II sporulation protein D
VRIHNFLAYSRRHRPSNRPALTLRLTTLVAGLAVAGVLASLAFVTPVSAATGDFVIQGRGNGHGTGLSQWGAWQGARSGATHQQILSLYYPGAELADVDPNQLIGVRISDWGYTGEEAFYRVRLSPTVTSATLVLYSASSGVTTQTLALGQSIETLNSGGLVQVAGIAGSFDYIEVRPGSGDGRVAIQLQATSGSSFTPTPREYWGDMRLQPYQGEVRLYNYVLLDRYTRGIAEIMPEWAKSTDTTYYAPEAVKAMAVAARTYALAEWLANQSFGGCLLQDNTNDICYHGYNYEVSNPGAAQLAGDTNGKVLKYSGVLHKTYFCSHSGGYTTNSAWDDAVYSWVVSVADPWSLSAPAGNPGYAWTVTISPTDLASKLSTKGVSVGTITSVQVTARDTSDAGSHAKTLLITGTSGSTTISARNFKAALGLKSTLVLSVSTEGTPTPTSTTVAPVVAPPPAPTTFVDTILPPHGGDVYRWRGRVAVFAEAYSYTERIRKVEFYVDGTRIGTDYRRPFKKTWNARRVVSGSMHWVTTVAYNPWGVKIGEDTNYVRVW